MNGFPSDIEGANVTICLKNGKILEGRCAHALYWIELECDGKLWWIDEEEIAAIGTPLEVDV